jgi:peptide/nickel transport system ATP-binding protein
MSDARGARQDRDARGARQDRGARDAAGARRPSDAMSAVGGADDSADATPLLDVRNLRKHFPMRKGFSRRVVGTVRAVDDVSFSLREGETLGLVGESGCGKTTTSRCILRAMQPTSGSILFRADDGHTVDLAGLDRRGLRPLRPQMQMIFQDPYGSLNPRMNLFDIVGEPLLVNGMRNRRERTERVAELLRMVGLRPETMQRFPHAFSGGQRQRIGIARALALHPRLVVADEPVSALDVSVQAQILNLLLEMQNRLHLTYLFVAHNLSVVRHICDRVAVMYVGKLVELADAADLYRAPKHPYTAALMAAAPIADPRVPSGNVELPGDVPSPAAPPSGCSFHPRCPLAQDICQTQAPEYRQGDPGHFVACHFARSG